MHILRAVILLGLLVLYPLEGVADKYSPVGSAGTPGTPTSCGTSPSVAGTDTVGTITLGTGTVTSCTLPFSATLFAAPVCVVTSDSSTITASITSISTSQLVVALSASLPGGKVTYFCPLK